MAFPAIGASPHPDHLDVFRATLKSLLAAALMLLPGPAQANEPVVYVTGTVVAPKGVNTTAPAIVSLDRLEGDQPAEKMDSSQCLANGSFLLKAPAAGEYRLKVTTGAQVLYQQLIALPAGGQSGLRIAAAPVVDPLGPVTLAPAVADRWQVRLASASGTLAPPGPVDAWVDVYWNQQEYGAGGSVMVAKDGTLSLLFPHVAPPPAAAEIVLTLRHSSLGWASLRLHQWPTGQETLWPSGGAVLKGTVVDRLDKPLPSVPVLCTRLIRVGCVLRRADRISYCTAVTDAAGHFRVIVPCCGTYDIRASLPGGLIFHHLFWLASSGQEVTVSARDELGTGAVRAPDFVQD